MNRLELLFAAGRPFSPFYAGAMLLRAWLYKRGGFRRHQVSAPVLSVGNLTWGGTGKTPLVIELAKFAQARGLRPAVISRGYRGSAKGPVNVVSDGQAVLLEAEQAGDEPRLLAERLPGVPVLTGIKRVLPARYAIDTLGADLILLDDGFQHLALERQLDIVLFQYEKPLGNGRVFPAGPLREPLAALGRADCFVFTGCPANAEAPSSHWFAKELQRRYPHRPVFFSSFELDRTSVAGKDGDISAPDLLSGAKVFGFCGIANPQSFRHSLLQSGAKLVEFKAFRDHHHYCQADVDEMVERCRKAGGDKVITTEKDFVKVRNLHWLAPLVVAQGKAVLAGDFFKFLEHYLPSLHRQ